MSLQNKQGTEQRPPSRSLPSSGKYIIDKIGKLCSVTAGGGLQQRVMGERRHNLKQVVKESLTAIRRHDRRPEEGGA